MTGVEDCVRELVRLAGIRAGAVVSYDWPAVEGSVGLRLPEDFKLLAEKVPAGWFRRFARALYPGRSGPFMAPHTSGQLDVMREWRDLGHAVIPFPVFPEPGGLLPWGVTVSGELFWLTGPEDPGAWPVVVATNRWDHHVRVGGTACEFLLEVASGRFDTSGFYEGPIVQAMDEAGTRITGQPIHLAGRGPVFTPDGG